MKLIIAALSVLFTISVASADCHGVGCSEFPSPRTVPSRCSAFGCSSQTTPPRCHAVGCEAARLENHPRIVTTTGTSSTLENLLDEDETAKTRAHAKARSTCGSTSILQISEWIIEYRGIPRTFHHYVDATATFECVE